jgi:small GTP-binding protein
MGAFSVGKTSVVRRFVHEVFDERYTTTLGVKIETMLVELPTGTVKLVIWDMEGAETGDELADLVTSRMAAYLQGVDGVMLVADGTRTITVDTALQLHRWLLGKWPGVPAILLLNKSDLQEEWKLTTAEAEEISKSLQCFTTSALSGDHVERSFHHLVQMIRNSE